MFKPAVCGLLLSLLSGPSWAALIVQEGYVRLLPPGSSNTAAFMVLKNEGDKEVKLIDARSPLAKRVELHGHQHDNGVMKMHRVKDIDIPAHGQQILKPGGVHIMLFDVAQMSEQTVVPMTLTLNDGQKLTLSLPVKPVLASGANSHGEHHKP